MLSPILFEHTDTDRGRLLTRARARSGKTARLDRLHLQSLASDFQISRAMHPGSLITLTNSTVTRRTLTTQPADIS